ncbi:MAG: sialidase family protein [Bacteroidota bacterium]|nr:sialidase family protein [Bacteroidota bacterium]
MQKLLFNLLFFIILNPAIYSQVNKNIKITPLDTSFIIYNVDNGHLGFPDIVKLPDYNLMIVYRQGTNHYRDGKIMRQYGLPNGYSWKQPEVLYEMDSMDVRDASVTYLKNGDIGLSFFERKQEKNNTFTAMGSYYSILKEDGKRMRSKYSINKNYAVSSPVVEFNNKLLIPGYGGIKSNEDYKTRISLFESDDQGRTWKENVINPESKKDFNLQEPALLVVDNKRMIMHIRTMADKKYSPKDKMMQAISDDGGKTWSDWKPYNFIGHAPYLKLLSNGVIISAFRILDDTYTLEGTAFIFSTDKGNTWSNPIIVDKQRKNNDSSYPSIQELFNNEFIIVYYCDNGKTIKGRQYKFEN